MQMFSDNVFINKMAGTIIMVTFILILRTMIVRSLMKHNHLLPNVRKRWIVQIKNTSLLLILIIIVVIWIEQVRTIAASLMVIAAAVVVATKELILNISGFFFKSANNFIEIGDRIEVNNIRGDVIDQTWTGTTILEIGSGNKTHQYTGATVFIPNSVFLSAPVKNETNMWGDYVYHIITIPSKMKDRWTEAETALMNAAMEVCAPYLENARRSMKKLASKHSLDAPTVDPRVHLQISGAEDVNLVLRIPVPAQKRGRVEQEILRKYLAFIDLSKSGHPESTDDANA